MHCIHLKIFVCKESCKLFSVSYQEFVVLIFQNVSITKFINTCGMNLALIIQLLESTVWDKKHNIKLREQQKIVLYSLSLLHY